MGEGIDISFLDEVLVPKYPEMLVNMTEGYYRISTDIPQGWNTIVDDLLGCIKAYTNNINIHNKHLPPVEPVIVDQIKSKYAELRFYYHGGDAKIEGMVDYAEYLADKTCEECGKPGTLTKYGSWYTVLCNDCIIEFNKPLKVYDRGLKKWLEIEPNNE